MAKIIERLSTLEKKGGSYFRLDNSIRSRHIPTPVYFKGERGGNIIYTIASGWSPSCWSDTLEAQLMLNREGNIGLMLFHPEEGEVWMHVHIFENFNLKDIIFVMED